jgi:menaquinone-dependent protoporphyrinogen oxidase
MAIVAPSAIFNGDDEGPRRIRLQTRLHTRDRRSRLGGDPRRWLEVDCLDTHEVESLEPYGAVVLGSAVYMKRWRGDARHFLRTYGWRLEHMPFWVFSSGPVGDPAEEDPSWLEPAKIVKKVEHLGVRGHVVFGGRVPAEPSGPIERAMVENTPPEYRDRRDWGEIHAWATGIASELKPPLSSAA